MIDHEIMTLRTYQEEVTEDTEAALMFGSNNIVVNSPPACVPGYTEFLTPTGWKRIDEYNYDDLICIVSENGRLSFEKPIKYINEYCKENFINIKTSRINIIVSKNHTIPYILDEDIKLQNTNFKLNKIKAIDLINSDKNIYIPIADGLSILRKEITCNSLFFNLFDKNEAITKEVKPEDNKHYCFETSAGFWLMRQNGNIYPTGNSGKSLLMAEISRRLTKDNSKKIVISLTISALVDQVAKHLDMVKAPYSVLKAGRESEFDDTKQIQVCQAQTLHARLEKLDKFKANYYIQDECFTPDTEIFTEKGFIRFDKLNKETKVAQYNSSNDNISFAYPTRYIKNYTTKDLVHIYSDKGVDLITTKNHNMLIFDKKTNISNKIHTIDLVKSVNNLIKVSSLNTTSLYDDELSYDEKLAIAFQADGSYHYIYSGRYKDSDKCSILFSFSKERKIKEFTCTFKTANKLKSQEKLGNKKKQNKFLLENVDQKKISKNLRDVFDITKFSTKKAIAFLDYLMIWDGYISKSGSYYYSSTIKDNVDFVQEVSILAGKKTKLGIQKDERSENFSDIYRIYISHENSFTTYRIKSSLIEYDGFVYCVEVPDGNIIVRRNGKIAITGNCHREYKTKRTRDILDHLEIDARIGYSGTPYDEAGFLLDGCELLTTTTAIDLQEQGYLCPIKYFVPKWAEQIDFSGLKKSGNDYSEKDLNDIINTDNHLRLAIESMNQMNAKNKKTMVFCSGIEQAEKFTKMLQAQGYKAFAYHSKMDKKESEKIIQAFINNTRYIPKINESDQPTLFDNNNIEDKISGSEVTCLVSINKLGIGFDCPDVKLGVQLRPTKIKSLFIQQVMRLARKHPSKEFSEYLDLGQTLSTHGFHTDVYHPPKRTGDKSVDQLALQEANQNNLEDLQVILDANNLEEITFNSYNTKIQAIKNSLRKNLYDLSVKELAAAFDIAKDHKEIITIATIIYTIKYGRPVSKAGKEYDYRPENFWSTSTFGDNEDFHVHYDMQYYFDKYPEMKTQWIKALRTRCRTIVKEGRKLFSITGFIKYLAEKYEEEMYSLEPENNNERPYENGYTSTSGYGSSMKHTSEPDDDIYYEDSDSEIPF